MPDDLFGGLDEQVDELLLGLAGHDEHVEQSGDVFAGSDCRLGPDCSWSLCWKPDAPAAELSQSCLSNLLPSRQVLE